MAERRIKEIGVRKVLGASVLGLLGLVARGFLTLVVLANLVAWPVAWYVTSSWQQNFAYPSPFDPKLFVLTGLGTLILAALTIGYQSLRAALTNPAAILKHE